MNFSPTKGKDRRMTRLKGLSYRNLSCFIFILIAALLSIVITAERTSGQAKELRNPFSLPPGVYLSGKGHGAGIKEKTSTPGAPTSDPLPNPLKVKAILISNHICLASIGQHIVKVGDWIHGERVSEITRDRVVLSKGNNRRTLFLEQSPVSVTVDEK